MLESKKFINGGGAPYSISKGVSPWGPGVLRALYKARGKRSTQSLEPVASVNLDKVSLIVLFIRSTWPELWGLYAQCNFYSIPNSLATN